MDPSLLRLLTRRFRELQGLRHVVVLITVLAMIWSQPYLKLLRYAGPVQAAVGLIVSVLPCLFVVGATRWFDDRYRRQFGRVDARAANLEEVTRLVLIGGALWIDFVRTTARPSAVLIAGAVLALHVVVRDWPWRAHHLIAAVSCALGAWVTATVPARAIAGRPEVLQIALTIVLLSGLVPAWLDHRLLVRTLQTAPSAGEEQRADAQ